MPTPPSTAPKLYDKATKLVQAVSGTFVLYARGVNPTMLPAPNEISLQQASPTVGTTNKCNMLMDYNTYPKAVLLKHFPPSHHRIMRWIYIQRMNKLAQILISH